MTTQRKPSLQAKLEAWQLAFTVVLDELRRATGGVGTDVVVAAARTAAILIQGTEEASGDEARR